MAMIPKNGQIMTIIDHLHPKGQSLHQKKIVDLMVIFDGDFS
jgi:hypothetical protein